jgi:thiosulfate reductase cytochrome b subunit
MVYRHTLITRITHAAFFLSFLGLAVSGAQMYFHRHWIPLKVPVLHQYLGLAMLASGVIYILSGIASGQLGKLLFSEQDVSRLWPMTAYYLRLRATPPVYDSYNPLQKLAYTIVLLLIAPLIVATGFALWKHSPLQSPMSAIFGRKTASIWHVGFALELVLFFGGHMLMVATTGLRNNVRSIVTGWYQLPETPLPQTAAARETAPTRVQSPQASPLRQARRMPASR